MLVLSLRIGQAVTIGEEAFVRAEEKSGRYVKLAIETMHKVDIIADGILPRRFIEGVSGRLEPYRRLSVVRAASG